MSASLATVPRSPNSQALTPAKRLRSVPAGRVPAERHVHSTHGRRIAMAFAEVEQLPALCESRERIISLTDEPNVATHELVAAIESDPAIAMAVMRAANAGALTNDRLETARAATERIGTPAVRELAQSTKSFDFFERAGGWELTPQKFRLHGLATQHATERIAAEIFHPHRERLALASLVHDIGKLVLIRAYPGYPAQVHRGTTLPEERIHRERRELGIDHAVVGGVLLRRWGLPASITSAVEHHHDAEAEGDAAILRVADLLAHYQRGDSISPAELQRSACAAGLGSKELRRLMCDLGVRPNDRHRQVDPCPLSGREMRVLQRLSEGSVYKEIAHELDLSASTVRSHLNKIYRKLGARDRAQAVLIASRRGWL